MLMPVVCGSQTTIRKPISVEGRGFYNGKRVCLRFMPAKANQGVAFVHNGVRILVCCENMESMKRIVAIRRVNRRRFDISKSFVDVCSR